MSKKMLFGILCFFSFFFVFNFHAKAETVIDHKPQFDLFKEGNYEFVYGGKKVGNAESKMKEVAKTLRDNNIKFIILSSPYYGSTTGVNSFYVLEFSSSNVDASLSHWSGNYYELKFSDINFLSRADMIVNSNSNSYWDNLINYINENHHLPVSGVSVSGWNISNSILPVKNTISSSNTVNYGLLIWDTNMTIKLSTVSDYDGLKYGDTVYTKGSILPSYMDIPNYGKTYYSFTESINTLGKSQVRFRFDVPTNELFSFELNHSVTYPIGYDSAPYLEAISSNRKTILPLDKKETNLSETIYYDTQTNSFASNIQEVNLVVDLEWLSDKDENVLIHFDSEYSFTYEYVTESSYIEVDWSGKYGIMLLPKLSTDVEHYYDIYSDIFFKGNYLTMKIFPDDYTDLNPLEEHIYKNYNEFYGGYKYYFHSDYNKYKMFFVNQYYQDEPYPTILKYDSRYFVHSICSSENTCEVVKNPNDINSDVNVKPPDPFLSDEHENGNEIVNKILDLIKGKLPILEQIPQIFSFFNQSIQNPQPPHFIVDLTEIGFDIQVEMDFSLFDEYRDIVFFIIKLSATYVTAKKLLDILGDYYS